GKTSFLSIELTLELEIEFHRAARSAPAQSGLMIEHLARSRSRPHAALICSRRARYNSGMRHALRRHPESLCVAAMRIEVDVARPSAGSLVLTYIVDGNISELRLPPAAALARGDELWQHTCFEAFIGTAAGAAYYEFNFAPSTRWAAYRFSSHRSGMRVATEIAAPRIERQSASDRYTLQASLRLEELPGLPHDRA